MKLKQSIMTYSLLGGGADINSVYQFDLRNFFLSANTEDIQVALEIIWGKIKPLNPELIFGAGIGGLPLLTFLKLYAYNKDNIDLKILFLRDQRKTYGTKKLIEGEHPDNVIGKRSVFVDDLMNYSKTYKKTIQSLMEEDYKLNIVGAVSLVDFWKPNGSRSYNSQGFPMLTAFRRHDFGLTRDERNLPKLLNINPLWKTHVFHDGPKIMPYKSAPVIYKNYLLCPEWEKKRKFIIQRDKNCQGCLDAPIHEVHHLTYKNVGNELMFELVGLCRECHSRCHQEYK
jgi:orotate phosphoribosyltransferase